MLGSSDDTELLNRLADDLRRFDINAFPNVVSTDEPAQIHLPPVAIVLVLWTRAAAGSRWLSQEVGSARQDGTVIIGRVDDVAPPPYAGDLHHVNLTRWRAGGDGQELEAVAQLIRSIASDTREPESSATSLTPAVDELLATATATTAAAARALAATAEQEASPGVDLRALRPGALELLVLADAIARKGGSLRAQPTFCWPPWSALP